MIIDLYKERRHDKKLLIADRDGTLNIDIGYPHKIKDLKVKKEVLKKLSIHSESFDLAIVTNQSGIGRGFFTLESAKIFNAQLVNVLNNEGINVTSVAICPHRPDENCKCRKPSPNLIIKTLEINKELNYNSLMLGDKYTDFLSANRAGVKYADVNTEINAIDSWVNNSY